MKRIMRHLSIGLIVAMMSSTAFADNPGRPAGRNPGRSQGSTATTPSRPCNNGAQKPTNSPGANQPGNQHGNRPGGAQPGNRPGGNRPGTHRPPQGPTHGGHNGFHRPTPPPRPLFNGFHRPVPPPAWRPGPGGPAFGTILGITLGSAIAVSLNHLYNNGYVVSNYGSNTIYLRDVNQMNMLWPDAALYYDNGRLCGSEFTYGTSFFDMSRYYSLYNTFTAQYGYPARVVNNGNVTAATWFGGGNRFVTIEYTTVYPSFGAPSYYTTLKFGN